MRKVTDHNNKRGKAMSHSFPNLHIIDHPLIQHKLTLMRMQETKSGLFRKLLREIALLMGYELTKDFPTKTIKIQTPITETEGQIFDGHDIAIIPILRAGLGMADALRELIPTANEGHIGLYRDPDTHFPVEYLVKLPEIDSQMFIVVDPMVATGHSAVHAIDILVGRGVQRKNIRFLALVAAPEGIAVFNEKYGDIPIYAAALDDHLNDHAYIVPGLGDAGDRLFGTK
jgi:uracil phosphoribosyltransferase